MKNFKNLVLMSILVMSIGNMHIQSAATNNINAVNEDGETQLNALSWSVNIDDMNEIENLIQQGANVNQANKSGYTPLMIAAHQGNLPLVQILLGHGAHVNPQGWDGSTALHHAAQGWSDNNPDNSNYAYIIQLLIAHGADTNIQGKSIISHRNPIQTIYDKGYNSGADAMKNQMLQWRQAYRLQPQTEEGTTAI